MSPGLPQWSLEQKAVREAAKSLGLDLGPDKLDEIVETVCTVGGTVCTIGLSACTACAVGFSVYAVCTVGYRTETMQCSLSSCCPDRCKRYRQRCTVGYRIPNRPKTETPLGWWAWGAFLHPPGTVNLRSVLVSNASQAVLCGRVRLHRSSGIALFDR